jgi:hypothetical protein
MRSLALALAVCAFASPARAQDSDRAKVKRLYLSATKHYNLSEFQDALNDYKEAYRIKSDPVFLYDIAQCHRQLDDPAAAAREYRAYLREAPEAKNRQAVEKLIEEMDKAVIEKQKSAPPLGTEPPSEKPENPPQENPPQEKQPEVQQPPVAPLPPPKRGPDIIGITLTAFGAAVLVTGIALAVVGGLDDSQAHDASQMIDLQKRQDLEAQSGTLGVAGYVAIGVGAALIVGGVVKLALGRRRAAEAHAWLSPRPGGLVLGGSF